MSIERDDRETLLNAWLDGELDDASARALEAEGAADWQLAGDLQALLAELGDEPPPAGLEQKLLAVPALDVRPRSAWQRALGAVRSWFTLPNPTWRYALAAIPVLAVGLWLAPAGDRPDDAAIEQGRRDLAVAMAYLQKTHSRAGVLVSRSVDRGVTRPVLGVVEETVQSQLDLSEET